jgi:dihydroorotase
MLVRNFSAHPAALLGVPGGTLAPGSPADITGLYLQRPWTVDPKKFVSKGHVTPFAGMTFAVRPAMTVVAGSVIMRDGEMKAGRATRADSKVHS